LKRIYIAKIPTGMFSAIFSTARHTIYAGKDLPQCRLKSTPQLLAKSGSEKSLPPKHLNTPASIYYHWRVTTK
jgi:hypothetical protein